MAKSAWFWQMVAVVLRELPTSSSPEIVTLPKAVSLHVEPDDEYDDGGDGDVEQTNTASPSTINTATSTSLLTSTYNTTDLPDAAESQDGNQPDRGVPCMFSNFCLLEL